MPHRLFLRFSCVVLASCLVAGFSMPAKAGFQWVAPSDAAAVPSAPSVSSPAPYASPILTQPTLPAPAPAPVVANPEIISPVIITAPSKPTVLPPAPVSASVAPTYNPPQTYNPPPVYSPPPAPASVSASVTPTYDASQTYNPPQVYAPPSASITSAPLPAPVAPPTAVANVAPAVSATTPISVAQPVSTSAPIPIYTPPTASTVTTSAAPSLQPTSGDAEVTREMANIPPVAPSPAPLSLVSSGAPINSPADNLQPTPAPLSMSTNDTSSGIVRGFANQVPLVVALRQILPTGIGFSVDPNVDLGTLVSFRGGKSWRETLREALTPLGLATREQGEIVVIVRADQKNQVVVPDLPPLPMEPVPQNAPISSVSSAAPSVDMIQPAPALPPASLPETRSVPPMHALEPPSGAVDVSSAPLPPSATTPVVETWNAERGDSLRKVLEDWSRRANVELSWMAEYDYPLQASVNVSGTFEDAVRDLLVGFESAHPQPVAKLHANTNLGQMVLVVETRGNSYSD